MSMTIKEFMVAVHRTALAKGWWEYDETAIEPKTLKQRNVAEMIALMHSEVAEALECYRMPDEEVSSVWYSETGTKPEGFMVELADLLIRIADTCEAMKIPLDGVLCNTTFEMLGWGRVKLEQVPEALQTMNKRLVSACDGVAEGTIWEGLWKRRVDLNCSDYKYEAAQDFAEIFQICGQLGRSFEGCDLEKATLMKMSFNETRPFRHGGKRC